VAGTGYCWPGVDDGIPRVVYLAYTQGGVYPPWYIDQHTRVAYLPPWSSGCRKASLCLSALGSSGCRRASLCLSTMIPRVQKGLVVPLNHGRRRCRNASWCLSTMGEWEKKGLVVPLNHGRMKGSTRLVVPINHGRMEVEHASLCLSPMGEGG